MGSQHEVYYWNEDEDKSFKAYSYRMDFVVRSQKSWLAVEKGCTRFSKMRSQKQVFYWKSEKKNEGRSFKLPFFRNVFVLGF